MKRRRTSSHDTRIAKKGRRGKRRKLDGSGGTGVGMEKGAKMKKMSRRLRRRLEFRESKFGFQISGDGTKRLKTHLWHVKRFTMEKKWGFCIPLGLHGSGRGSRAILKCMKKGAVVHDASYCSPVQLMGGPKESLLAVMKMVLVLSPSDLKEEVSRQIINGVRHGSALLHHFGAPKSRFIGPVNFMRRPLPRTMLILKWRRTIIQMSV